MNHIVTPFSRPENLSLLTPMIEATGAEWHRIECESDPDWVEKHLECYWKLNQFLAGPLVDTDRYCFLCDDDFYEPGFFPKLDAHKGEVVICSMHRGHHPVPSNGFAHPAGKVLACPENMHINVAGLPQICVLGSVAKTMRFENRQDADGVMIEYLVSHYPIDYAPECWVWWNYLQPGRYDK